MSYRTACPGKELLICELLAIPDAAARTSIQLNVHKTLKGRGPALYVQYGSTLVPAMQPVFSCVLYEYISVLDECVYLQYIQTLLARCIGITFCLSSPYLAPSVSMCGSQILLSKLFEVNKCY